MLSASSIRRPLLSMRCTTRAEAGLRCGLKTTTDLWAGVLRSIFPSCFVDALAWSGAPLQVTLVQG